MRIRQPFFAFGFIALISLAHPQNDQVCADDSRAVTDTEVRSAIVKSLPLLETGARVSAEQRKCFTCHNQAIPVLALAEAQRRGFAVDESKLKRQVEHTAAHLERGRENFLEGRGQGGRAISAGYALWTLNAGNYKPDETTQAVTEFLLQYQQQDDHWSHAGSRPPSSGSDFTTTYVALRGLEKFATKSQQSRVVQRRETIRTWILNTTSVETEDRVFKLRALKLLKADRKLMQSAVEELLQLQQADGSWAQKPDMTGDAYAAATVISALLEAGDVAPDSPSVQRGLRYLIDTQQPGGSWHVVTRADPFQTYYESGYPHGDDQFISISAAGWATLALLQSLPEEDR